MADGVTYDAATTKYVYDYAGNLLKQQEPNLVASDSTEYSVQNVYNALGNVVKTTNINKKSATNEYNTTTGLLKSSTDFNGNTTSYTYNCFHQVYEETLPTGGKQITYYDENGNVGKVDTLRSSGIYDSVRYVYDSRNRNIAVIGNDGEKDIVTQYEYDGAGNRTKLVQGLEEVSDLNNLSGKDYSMNTYTYNYLNQCVSATDAMGQTQTYEYDLFGNVLQSVDRNGDTTLYIYTPLGHLSYVCSTKDNTSVSYTYDKLGNRTSMTDATGTTDYIYNIYNQLVREEKGNTVKEYTYDLNGNQLSFKLKDNGVVTIDETYSYNKTNQVSAITAGAITANFTYDANGNMLTYKRNNITTSYTYNSGNMPTSVTTQRSSSQRFESDTITYYLNGNKKTTKDINGNITTYVYDGLGRLSSEGDTNGYSAAYSYDNYGNRVGKSVNDGDNSQNVCYTYNKNNQLVTETTDKKGSQEINRYFYDANGNQTFKNIEKVTLSSQKDYSLKLNNGGNSVSYEYDGLNRLKKADDGTNVSTYTYDGNNLRQSKTVNGVTTQHIYNGMNVVQEKEGGRLKATYHRAGNQIIYSEVSGSNNFYIYNAQGNVSKLLNTGYETVADYTFDAFGVQKAVNGEVYNPFRHNGEYYDDELGYTYLRNRYYDNNTGRFISEDPVKDGLNWYSYCYNNPIAYVDVDGAKPRRYQPELWNNSDVQQRTNCYAYALDFMGEVSYGNKKGTFLPIGDFALQPGDLKSNTPTLLKNLWKEAEDSLNMQVYSYAGAKLDSIGNGHTFRFATEANIAGEDLGENEWVVMLFTTSSHDEQPFFIDDDGVLGIYFPDYHWYRQNADENGNFDGTWSHKPGNDEVTNLDSSGNIINDPRNANRISKSKQVYLTDDGYLYRRVYDYDNYVGAFVVGY